MYHYTRDLKNSRYPEIKGLDINLMEEQFNFFKKNFNVIKMEDLISSIYDNKELPENPLLLTFDDGYIDNYSVALPMLKKFGFQGSFFIPAKTFKENKVLDVNKIHFILASASNRIEELLNDLFIELDMNRANNNYLSNDLLYQHYAIANRFDDKNIVFIKRILQTAIPESIRNIITDKLFKKYIGIPEGEFAKELYLNENQIQTLKKEGMHIGVHGYDHYWLGNLSEEEMMTDIDKAINAMKDYIDLDNWVMNYPYGSYNDNVIKYVSSKGCKLGLSTVVDVVDINNCNKYSLPRLDCNDFPPKSNKYLEY